MDRPCGPGSSGTGPTFPMPAISFRGRRSRWEHLTLAQRSPWEGRPPPMITVYTGPAPLAKMVHEELTQRGVGAALHAADPLGALFGSAAAPSFLESVVVPPEVAEQHRAEI